MAFNWRPTVGDTFESFKSLKEKIDDYCAEHRCVFNIGKSERLENSTLKDIPNADKLIYKYLNFECLFFGRPRIKPLKKTTREKSSFKRNCPAIIKVTLKDEKQLIISHVNLEHENHSQSQRFYDLLPGQRKLSPTSLERTEEIFRQHAKPQYVKNTLKNKFDKIVSNKDLANIKAQIDKTENGNELATLVELLKIKYGCEVETLTDENNVFKGLYFTTKRMKDTMAAYPEVLMVDGTYKLFNRDLTLLVFVVKDSIGRGEVVSSAILGSEDKETFTWAAKMFEKYNPEACKQMKVIITDKDMTERNCLADVFPHVFLLLCVFHTLKTFKKKLHELRVEQQLIDKLINILQKLTYSSGGDEYNQWYTELKKNAPPDFMEYYDVNWHEIRTEWVRGFMARSGNLNNYTNNHVESINKQIKLMVDKHSTLCKFGDQFFQFLQSHNQETDIKSAMEMLKVPMRVYRGDWSNATIQYSNYLSTFAFNHVEKHMKQSQAITLEVIDEEQKECSVRFRSSTITCTPMQCTCESYMSMGLPCKHILAVRRHFEMSLYDSSLCAMRWTKEHALKNLQFNKAQTTRGEIDAPVTPVLNTIVRSRKKPRTVNEKRKVFTTLVAGLVESASNLCGIRYDEMVACVKELTEASACGDRVRVTRIIENSNSQCNSEKNDEFDGKSSSVRSADIIMPIARKILGKPSGSGQTTSGYSPRKGSAKEFITKPMVEQQKLVLSWIVAQDIIENVVNGEYLVSERDVSHLTTENLKDQLASASVQLEHYSEFFTNNAFHLLKKLISDKVQGQCWFCDVCQNADSDTFIECPGCLKRIHKKCTSFKRKSSKKWFCFKCQ